MFCIVRFFWHLTFFVPHTSNENFRFFYLRYALSSFLNENFKSEQIKVVDVYEEYEKNLTESWKIGFNQEHLSLFDPSLFISTFF